MKEGDTRRDQDWVYRRRVDGSLEDVLALKSRLADVNKSMLQTRVGEYTGSGSK